MVDVFCTTWSYKVKGTTPEARKGSASWRCISCIVWLTSCEWLLLMLAPRSICFSAIRCSLTQCWKDGRGWGGGLTKEQPRPVSPQCCDTFSSLWRVGEVSKSRKNKRWIKKKWHYKTYFRLLQSFVVQKSRMNKLVQITRRTCEEMIALFLLHWQVTNKSL